MHHQDIYLGNYANMTYFITQSNFLICFTSFDHSLVLGFHLFFVCGFAISCFRFVCDSGAFDCLTGIWSVGAANETSRSRSVGWLRGGPPQKVKAVCYAQNTSQVAYLYNITVVTVSVRFVRCTDIMIGSPLFLYFYAGDYWC